MAMTAAMALLSTAAYAQQAASSFEDMDRLEQRVSRFAGDARQPHVDRRLRLSACGTPPELLWYGTGQTTVLVRCGGPRSWQVYVPVPAAARRGQPSPAGRTGTVVVKRAVPRGQVLTAADLKVEPATVVAGGVDDIDTLVGKMAVRPLNEGEAVRVNMVAAPPVVKRGDPVQIRNGVSGLEISAEGVAEEDAPQGSRVRVRNTASGSRMQAIVAGPGIVVLPGYKVSDIGRE